MKNQLKLKEGMPAPAFTLENQHGEKVSLEDFKGQKVALYFYSKDNTSGCTKQACAFAAKNAELKDKNVQVVGVSKDSVASHQKFAQKYDLPFTLLSDPDHQVLENYGVWQEKTMCGKTSMGTVRTTFLIDENGVIEKVMAKVKPDTNADDVLALV